MPLTGAVGSEVAAATQGRALQLMLIEMRVQTQLLYAIVNGQTVADTLIDLRADTKIEPEFTRTA